MKMNQCHFLRFYFILHWKSLCIAVTINHLFSYFESRTLSKLAASIRKRLGGEFNLPNGLGENHTFLLGSFLRVKLSDIPKII